MELFYFGLNPLAMKLTALILAVASVAFFYNRINSRNAGAGHVVFVVVVGFLCFFLWNGAYDLSSPISKMDAKVLHSHYKTSIEYPRNGHEFRDAMDELAEKNNIVTSVELSYIGTDLYTTYVTKNDWNYLARLYKESNLPQ